MIGWDKRSVLLGVEYIARETDSMGGRGRKGSLQEFREPSREDATRVKTAA